MTLIEVVVALGLFAIMSTAALSVLVSAITLTRDDKARLEAVNLASRELEITRDTFSAVTRGPDQVETNRVLNPSPLPGGRVGDPLVVNKVPYTVVRTAQWAPVNSAAASTCDEGTTSELAYLHVKVQVSWPELGDRPPVTMDTVMTPPKGTYSALAGHIGLKVIDSEGRPRSGVQVTARAASGATETGVTGDDGCALLAYLNAGSYAVTVSAPGFVNPKGDPTGTLTAQVQAGQLWRHAAGLSGTDRARDRRLAGQQRHPAGRLAVRRGHRRPPNDPAPVALPQRLPALGRVLPGRRPAVHRGPARAARRGSSRGHHRGAGGAGRDRGARRSEQAGRGQARGRRSVRVRRDAAARQHRRRRTPADQPPVREVEHLDRYVARGPVGLPGRRPPGGDGPMTATEQPAHVDEGTSLAEVLVAMGIFLVLTTILATTAIIGFRTSTGLGVRLDNSTQGQLGIAAVSKVLRTAVLPDQLEDQVCTGCAETAIIAATSTRVSFYANLNNTGQGPSLVTLRVLQDPDASDGSAILQQSTQPPIPGTDGRYSFCTAGTSGCRVDTRVVARGLLWPAGTVFGYYDFSGVAISGPTLASADLPRVSSVDVSISVQTEPGQAAYPASTAVQRVRLPNADINVLVQPS
jgi:type II secretory pathway pseudopilin PulG